MKHLIAQAENVVNLTNEVAGKNDRWLFIGALIFLLGFGILALRFLISRNEKSELRLNEMTDRHIKAMENMATVVATNTAVLQRVENKL